MHFAWNAPLAARCAWTFLKSSFPHCLATSSFLSTKFTFFFISPLWGFGKMEMNEQRTLPQFDVKHPFNSNANRLNEHPPRTLLSVKIWGEKINSSEWQNKLESWFQFHEKQNFQRADVLKVCNALLGQREASDSNKRFRQLTC